MKKVASGCQGKHIRHGGETNRNRTGICGGRADEEISHELHELISAPASGIILCNWLACWRQRSLSGCFHEPGLT